MERRIAGHRGLVFPGTMHPVLEKCSPHPLPEHGSCWQRACRFRERCPHLLERDLPLQLPEHGSCWKRTSRFSCQNSRYHIAEVPGPRGGCSTCKRRNFSPAKISQPSFCPGKLIGHSITFRGLTYQRGNAAPEAVFPRYTNAGRISGFRYPTK